MKYFSKVLIASLLVVLCMLCTKMVYSQPTLIWSRHMGPGSGPRFYNWLHFKLSVDGNGNAYVIGLNDELPVGTYILSYDTYGGTRFCDSLNAVDYICGTIDSQYASYAFESAGTFNFAKYSSNGSLLWRSILPYVSLDKDNIIPTQQYVYMLVGIEDPRSLYRIESNNGTLLNSVDVPFQSSYCFGILNSDYILGGKVGGSSNDSLLVIRMTSSGAQVWRRAFIPPSIVSNYPGGISVTSSGNIYYFVNIGSDIIVSKLNSSGSLIWSNIYSNKGNVYNNPWVIDNAENFYVITTSSMFKINSSGVLQWTDPNSERVICLDNNNDVLVATDPTYDTLRTSKFSSTGNKLWSVDYHFTHPTQNSIVNGIACDNKFNVYVSANFDSGSHCGLVLKYGDVYTVSGQIRFQDNNQPVNTGCVKALHYDRIADRIITVDSTSIQSNGNYSLIHVPPQDSLYIMAFENDESMLAYVPTYYPSSTTWQNATVLYTTGNLSNINVLVYRINNTGGPYHISGHIFENTGNPLLGLNQSVVYAKVGNDFKAYSISDFSGLYRIDSLPSATYSLIVDRIGYSPMNRSVLISNYSKDSIDITFNMVGVVHREKDMPKSYVLENNYPNPFNPETKIAFGIPHASNTKLIIYDILGREVATLINEKLEAGNYNVEWNAANYSSGIYFYKLESGDFVQTKKMVLIK
ncbi:MAG: T9SS type A sorting domain-containing protein [Ignavibacteria bacterium]